VYITDTKWKVETYNTIRDIITDTIGDYNNTVATDLIMTLFEIELKKFYLESVATINKKPLHKSLMEQLKLKVG
jgi:hypothetical protein